MGAQLQMQISSAAAAPSFPGSMPPGILQRKCACGGAPGMSGECAECRDNYLQRKASFGTHSNLAISQPGDAMEREADRVADAVMSAASTASSASSSEPRADGKYPPEPAVEDKTLSRKASGAGSSVDEIPPLVHDVVDAPGALLDAVTRNFFEARFGHDFSRVRVHSGAAAEQSARQVNASAYTMGQNVVFGAGQYAPGTHDGRRLIAHELTHVVQQSGADAVRVGYGDDQRAPPPIPSLAQVVRSAGAIGRMVNSTFPGLLMRQPEEKDETEQSPQKGQTDKPAGKATPAADPCTAPDPQLPVYKEAEQKQRDQILQDMLRDLTATEKKDLCKRFRRALGAFSTSQMLTMKGAGVRFWRAGEFPPPFKNDYAPAKAGRSEIARYHPEVRIIQWGPRAGVDDIRHELAHAWDHVRGGKVPRLDAYKGARLEKAVRAPATFSSESSEKRLTIEETVGGKQQKVGLSIKDVYDRFMKLPPSPHWSFANSKTDPEHVTSDVREFYAEGYSVFHGDNEDAQAQLLCDAPELYQLLESEANEKKLAVPDRGKLAANNKTNNRKCVS